MLPWRRWLPRRRIALYLNAYTRAPVCAPERASPVAVYKVAGLCCAWQPVTPVILRFRANKILLGSFAERAHKVITSRPIYCHARALVLTSSSSRMKQSTLGKFFGAKTPDAAPPKPKKARAGMGGGASVSASPPVLKEQTNGSEKKRSREASHCLLCQQT